MLEHFQANFGREPAENFTYDDLRTAIHPDGVDRWQRVVQSALQSDGELHIEYRIVKPHGELSWFEIRAQTRCDQAGEPLEMTGVSIDITERRPAEAHRAVMASEMAHRMKNMLAITQSIVTVASRRSLAGGNPIGD